MGTSKNSNFFVRARKHRPESRSLRGVNEDSRTELTPLSRKKCIFRDALEIVVPLAFWFAGLELFVWGNVITEKYNEKGRSPLVRRAPLGVFSQFNGDLREV